MSEKMKTYKIGENTYTQEQITSGQIKQLKAALSSSDIKFEMAFDAAQVVTLLADKAAIVCAILICEEGKSLKDKNPEELEKEIEFDLYLDKQVEIIKDFFLLTPLTSIWTQIAETLQTLIKTNLNSTKEFSKILNGIGEEKTK